MNDTVILDAQVVGTGIPLELDHAHKVLKYSREDLLSQIEGHPITIPTVSSITLSFRGIWAQESVTQLLEMGLTKNDIKIITIRSLQGSVSEYRAFHKMTTALTSG